MSMVKFSRGNSAHLPKTPDENTIYFCDDGKLMVGGVEVANKTFISCSELPTDNISENAIYRIASDTLGYIESSYLHYNGVDYYNGQIFNNRLLLFFEFSDFPTESGLIIEYSSGVLPLYTINNVVYVYQKDAWARADTIFTDVVAYETPESVPSDAENYFVIRGPKTPISKPYLSFQGYRISDLVGAGVFVHFVSSLDEITEASGEEELHLYILPNCGIALIKSEGVIKVIEALILKPDVPDVISAEFPVLSGTSPKDSLYYYSNNDWVQIGGGEELIKKISVGDDLDLSIYNWAKAVLEEGAPIYNKQQGLLETTSINLKLFRSRQYRKCL